VHHEKGGMKGHWVGKDFSSLGKQNFDVLGFMLLDHGMILINGGDW